MATVAELKAQADSLGITYTSKIRKDDLLALIEAATRPAVKVTAPMSNARRCDNYDRQNGTPGRYTPRQWRRIGKGIRKASGVAA